MVFLSEQVSVQLRIPKQSIQHIDAQVKAGRFKSRSDAIKHMVTVFEEKEKIQQFLQLLLARSNEAQERKNLVAFSDL